MTRFSPAAILIAALTLGACSSAPATDPAAPAATDRQAEADDTRATAASSDIPSTQDTATEDNPDGTPHGYVAGAAEVQEQQRSLLTVDAAGSVDLTDLVSEESVHLGDLGPVTALADDGRFVVTAGADGTVTVVDSGLWTTDHGDHVHYYRAEPAVIGTLDLSGTPVVVSTESRTAVAAGGRAVLLDREQLGQGTIVPLGEAEVDPQGMVAPLSAGSWVVTAENTVRILDLDGATLADSACPEPQGGIVTRVGVVVGCADGARLVLEDGTIESVPYPAGTDPALQAASFAGRTGRPTVAAVAAEVGFWLLDTRERTWQLVPTSSGPVQVSAVDDRDGHVVGVLADGTVVVWDATGAELGRAAELAGEVDDTLRLTVDADRAYVRAATPDQALEIDFRDSARVARTLDLPGVVHLAEVGL